MAANNKDPSGVKLRLNIPPWECDEVDDDDEDDVSVASEKENELEFVDEYDEKGEGDELCEKRPRLDFISKSPTDPD